MSPKLIRPAPGASPAFAFGGRGGRAFAGRGSSPYGSTPFSPAGGDGRGANGVLGGRARMRALTPLPNYKYVRPEFKAELERQKAAAAAGGAPA